MIKKLLRLSLPLWILGGGLALLVLLVATKPQAERREPPEILPQVEVQELQPEDYRVRIETQGTVLARTNSVLIPEVSGRVVEVSPQFREGGFFREGDVLLRIDPSDYETAVTLAESEVARARLRLAEEEAQTRQARRDWERLGNGEPPDELVLRQPQLAAAKAELAAAKANLRQARRNLERTRIVAPYAGRVLRKEVDVGQVVSPGTRLAEVYAVDYAELRLPLTLEEYALLGLPRQHREEGGDGEFEERIPVTLRAEFGRREVNWSGRLVRVEGSVDLESRQLYVVAQVDDPYGPRHEEPLKRGLFVEAEIEGKLLEDVYRMPRTALREGRYVLTLTGDNGLKRIPVDSLWNTAEEVVFRERAIEPGTRACLTQLALAVDGMKVKPLGSDPDGTATAGIGLPEKAGAEGEG